MAEKSSYAANTVAAKLFSLVGSPTELVLGTALFDKLSGFYTNWWCSVCSMAELRDLDPVPNGGSVIAIVPQFQIPDVGRVDFGLLVPQLEKRAPLIVVECDGHEFHERTPEQASKDRKRDRAMVALGVPVLRYTGADILRGSTEAAEEIADAFDVAVQQQLSIWMEHVGRQANLGPKPGKGVFVPYQWPPTRK